MHREGYRTLKSPVCVKEKYNIAHNFFRTKATDLKITFFKSHLKIDVETCVSNFDICLKQNKNIFYIF